LRLESRGLALALLTAIAPISSNGQAAGPEVRFHDSPQDRWFGTVAVTGLPSAGLEQLGGLGYDDWSRLFPVHILGTGIEPEELPPILGGYEVEDGSVRFRPRFPFAAGMNYRARFDGPGFDGWLREGGSTPRLELEFTMPAREGAEATVVEAVYPTAEILPSNLLRLYVHFSAPMRAREVSRHVHLFDSAGEKVALPFVEVKGGLWDPARRRLTLFFHPGRIKRGVAPREQMGPPLVPGETYRLVIDRQMLDGSGEPLGEMFERSIRAGSEDRESPDIQEWQVRAPSGPTAPVSIDFPEPLDHALLRRLITVEHRSGAPVLGRVRISRGETRWALEPEEPWVPGDYVIRVSRSLEDLAGNTLDALFEEKSGEGPVTRVDPAGSAELPFQVPG
jgi:hypothetical protein